MVALASKQSLVLTEYFVTQGGLLRELFSLQ